MKKYYFAHFRFILVERDVGWFHVKTLQGNNWNGQRRNQSTCSHLALSLQPKFWKFLDYSQKFHSAIQWSHSFHPSNFSSKQAAVLTNFRFHIFILCNSKQQHFSEVFASEFIKIFQETSSFYFDKQKAKWRMFSRHKCSNWGLGQRESLPFVTRLIGHWTSLPPSFWPYFCTLSAKWF